MQTYSPIIGFLRAFDMLLYTAEIQESNRIFKVSQTYKMTLENASSYFLPIFSLFPSASEGKTGSTLSCLRKEPWQCFLILFPNPTGLEEREV